MCSTGDRGRVNERLCGAQQAVVKRRKGYVERRCGVQERLCVTQEASVG
jgi:hypothetical protein